MRKLIAGVSIYLLSALALAACGNEPEPLAPIEPSFDRTTESTDTDRHDPVLPETVIPDTETVPPAGSLPGEIPEIMEPEQGAVGSSNSDTTTGILTDPAVPTDELGTPQ